MPLIDSDWFVLTRNDVSRRCRFLQIREHVGAGIAQVDRLEDDDWFILNRGDEDYRVRWSNIAAAVAGNTSNIRDTDFFVVERGGTQYRYTFEAFSIQLQDNPRPWEDDLESGWADGLLHFQNLTEDVEHAPQIQDQQSHRVYTIFGEEILPVNNVYDLRSDTEYVMSVNSRHNPDSISLLSAGWESVNWDFGPLTDTSRFITMATFLRWTGFNSPTISRISTDNARSVVLMFNAAVNFNQDVSHFNLRFVTDLNGMFAGALAFNHPSVGTWDVSNIREMTATFTACFAFNQPLNSWDVRRVQSMDSLFNGSGFNQRLDAWKPQSLTAAGRIFRQSPFDQDISMWCVPDMPGPPFEPFDETPMKDKTEWHPVWGTCPGGVDDIPTEGRWEMQRQLFASDLSNCQRWRESTIAEIPAGGRREVVLTRRHGGVYMAGGNGASQQLIDASTSGSAQRTIYIHRRNEQIRVRWNGSSYTQYPGGIAGMALIYEVNLGYYRINGQQYLREGGWATFRHEIGGNRSEYVWDVELDCNSQDLPSFGDWGTSCDLTAQEMYLKAVYVKAGNGSYYYLNMYAYDVNAGTSTVRWPIEQATQCLTHDPSVKDVTAHEETFDANGDLVDRGPDSRYWLSEDAYRSLQ